MNNQPPDKTLPIEMRGLSATAMKNPSVTIVSDVNWKVQLGEFWVVGAPQHSGKSDFLMMAGGITSPAGGEYRFLGEPMPIFEGDRMEHRLKLGFVFDGGQLLGSLTIAENIALPLRYHSTKTATEQERRVEELLELTGLKPWANSTPLNVARSWQQRAGLARALALSPQLLLLDSPLTGLDVRHAAWWLNFLDALSRGHRILEDQRVTLVATADDLRPWRNYATRVACLKAGKLVVLGGWDEAERSGDAVVRELL
jgi:phospholipid/cholesterol/gamma-HCH transport system ATP-binding protein